MNEWQILETAPEDEAVLLATTGGWVDTAVCICDEDNDNAQRWHWFGRKELHPALTPLAWMPLPDPPPHSGQ